MHALIDSDMIVYEMGQLVGDDGECISAPHTLSRVDARIETIIERSGADTYQLYLTGKRNFRNEIATILPYKGKRPKDKPRWYKVIRHHLQHNWGAIVVEGWEADDAMSIEQYDCNREWDLYHQSALTYRYKKDLPEITIICTRDKDLNMVPGWHYGWETGQSKEKAPWFQDETSALRWFYTQLLIGDSVDNILGIFGMGPKAAAVVRLKHASTELEFYAIVFKEYQDRFGRYAEQFITENGRLLYMQEYEGQLWEPPVSITQLREQLGDWVLDQVKYD